jgi:hypothetical protein
MSATTPFAFSDPYICSMGLHDVLLPLCMHFLLRFYLRAICPNKCVIKINILLYPTILDSSVKTQYVHIYVFNQHNTKVISSN